MVYNNHRINLFRHNLDNVSIFCRERKIIIMINIEGLYIFYMIGGIIAVIFGLIVVFGKSK